ncbi:MAG TPA: hypothetical protein VLV78_06875 [Thermoanaerobaculia bacterium]|nr:hypothetical protein [Thermoanaerobaculia bacterium]
MRIVRDRRDARWLPSRFHFALFRLYAYFRLRAAKPEPAPGLILSVDRHQSAAEHFLVAICIVFVATTYFAALFETSMPTPLAYIVAVPASVVAFQGVIVGVGVLLVAAQRIFRISDTAVTRIASAILMGLMIGVGVIVAAGDASGRYIAWGFLILVAMNAAAAAVVFLLRAAIAEAERRFGAES